MNRKVNTLFPKLQNAKNSGQVEQKHLEDKQLLRPDGLNFLHFVIWEIFEILMIKIYPRNLESHPSNPKILPALKTKSKKRTAE